MPIQKETRSLGMPWEAQYGYAQAVRVGDTIYLSGQVSHDDEGNIVGEGDMEAQMRQAYANIEKVLAQYGAGMDNLVDEILFVTDMESAFAAAVAWRKGGVRGHAGSGEHDRPDRTARLPGADDRDPLRGEALIGLRRLRLPDGPRGRRERGRVGAGRAPPYAGRK